MSWMKYSPLNTLLSCGSLFPHSVRRILKAWLNLCFLELIKSFNVVELSFVKSAQQSQGIEWATFSALPRYEKHL